MDELIQQITSRTGISEDQARQAVEMAMSFAKSKLPEPIASQLDGFMGGGGGAPTDLMGQMGNLGNMFGSNQ
ncbi:MAG: hypothetical protein MUC48_09525 [Leptolyngbya sp. Prado105]|nr:hypothetical protein [Leptolyngbya sp. Prado105]